MIAALTVTAMSVVLTACSTEATRGSDVTLGVAASPSLATAFNELIGVFEAENPGTHVHLELGRSLAIVETLGQRTDLNVIAVANDDAIQLAEDQETVADSEVFARNHVVLAVPSGNPANVTSLSDLSRPDLRVSLCKPYLPCGNAAETLLSEAGVEPAVDSWGESSRSLSARLAESEFDVGIVYRTDVAASVGWVGQVDISEHERELTRNAGATRYFLARVLGGDREGKVGESVRQAESAFRSLVTSERGRQALAKSGFLPHTA